MRATFTLSPFPDGLLLTRLQSRLEALPGVRAAVLERQDQTASIDYDPPLTSDATIEQVIRTCGIAVVGVQSEPSEILTAEPQGRRISATPLTPEAAMARSVQDAESMPSTSGGSLMPETGEASRAAFPGHSV
jgi:hypothetical protein